MDKTTGPGPSRPADDAPIIRARNLHKTYIMGSARINVLTGASVDISAGELVAIMGASGSGKSTLLHILGALDIPERGEVRYRNVEIFSGGASLRDRLRTETFGFVFQFYHLLPELNVLENVLLPAMVASSILGWPGRKKAARAAARELIDDFGLTPRIRHRPNQLSGGERQRVALARALVNRPKVLYADEPTGNLDARTGQEILELLERLNDAGQTIVMVTHDRTVAARAHRTLNLREGKLHKTAGEKQID
jgi:ABC-type lipoprotein export system ATPase subunit